VVPITTTIEGSKMCSEYHVFHHPGPTFILVGVPLYALLRGTDNGECLKMVVGHSQYHPFPRRAKEGAEAVILPVGGHDHMGCFTDQVKLTRALVQNLDDAIKEVKLLGEHEEESSQKITELEALCKKLREDT
jgi:hypothetical protein